jgi:hypothetical protein
MIARGKRNLPNNGMLSTLQSQDGDVSVVDINRGEHERQDFGNRWKFSVSVDPKARHLGRR